MEIKFHFSASKTVSLRSEENLNDHFRLMGIKSLNKIKIATLLLRQIMQKCTSRLVLFSLRQQGKNKFTNKIERSKF